LRPARFSELGRRAELEPWQCSERIGERADYVVTCLPFTINKVNEPGIIALAAPSTSLR
jgi:hypothetical protein